MTKFVVEGSSSFDIEREDGGQAVIITLDSGSTRNGMFVRLQSWDETKEHAALQPFLDKRLRVTVEVLDD